MPSRSRASIAASTLLLGILLTASAARLSADTPATAPADKSDDILYEDSGAHSSATITQVLPNSATSQMNLDNIRRIRVKQGILIIEWGTTATTLIPHQFISAITINKRAPAATQPAAPH